MLYDTADIPVDWKSAVRTILLRNERGSIITRSRARKEWEAAFPFSFPYERNEAIATALADPSLKGRRITNMNEDGDVWEFFITFEERKVYTKINRLPNGKFIILYSAHIPNKGKAL